MEITEATMRAWGWSDETISWYQEDQRRLATLGPLRMGYYWGLFDAYAHANGQADDGVSRHGAFPTYEVPVGAPQDFTPDFRDFLAVMAYANEDGNIHTPGVSLVRYGEWVGFEVWLHCTEAPNALDLGDLDAAYPDVTWGYREAYGRSRQVSNPKPVRDVTAEVNEGRK